MVEETRRLRRALEELVSSRRQDPFRTDHLIDDAPEPLADYVVFRSALSGEVAPLDIKGKALRAGIRASGW
jgi:hypothetical protein